MEIVKPSKDQKPTMCKMPFEVKANEASLYRRLLACHCQHEDKGADTHKCTGAITLSEEAIVLRCKHCGDAKGKYTQERSE